MEVILIRDQRTTTHRVLDRAAQSYEPKSTLKSLKCRNDVATSCYTEATIARTKRNNHAQRLLPYNSHLTPTFYDDRGIRPIRSASVRVSWYLRCVIVILLVVSVHGNPRKMDFCYRETKLPAVIQELMVKSPPKWVEPCGPSEVSDDLESGQEISMPKYDQILGSICIETQTAYDHVQIFRDLYIKETYKTDFNNLNELFTKKCLPWLPPIPKKLGESLSQEYLSKLELDEQLVTWYEIMQLLAMSIEQMVWDLELIGNPFAKNFKECEFKLRSVLCEIQNAMMERGITPQPNVDRDRMPPEYRGDNLRRDTTCRIKRDWMIFRDYMNALEYINQVFTFLRLRLMQS
ncbi:uncharacterized protein LOC114928870 [Nylanderia fulva]|uniref:uncharacterized protein LOC114928870 n=1 Tax=Nylanderia fulva TaxID=613905 RepID=UPI0010FB59A7|nr:uncharacterized protein LOC114928870 [Nylanderia fulva]